MTKKIIVFLGVIIGFYGCSQYKYFSKDNVIYQKKMIAIPADSTVLKMPTTKFLLNIITLESGFWGTLKDYGDNLIIKADTMNKVDIKTSDIDLAKYPYTDLSNLDKYYFPEFKLIPDSLIVEKLTYVDFKFVLQGLAFPLRIRPKITSPELLDSIPQQVETGFNAAIAFGYKSTCNVFNSQKNVFGQNTDRYSVTPGVFLGLGATDLQKSNTRNPTIEFGRKTLTISFGVFIVMGYNSLNLGYAIGWDHATGEGSNGWIYQNKLWHGITIGIDIIK